MLNYNNANEIFHDNDLVCKHKRPPKKKKEKAIKKMKRGAVNKNCQEK